MARRGNFAFDISKPIRTGRLLKQGYFHKAFKVREFVLYPGFLVYYRNENDWKLDVTKGDTLGSRMGALKLRGASVSIALNAPKGCKFGLVVTAPDPANKRQLYLMNAASKTDRNAWIDAINQAIPVSSAQARKELAPETKEEPATESCSDDALAHPTCTKRQNTAHDAAIEVATHMDPEEEQREVDKLCLSLNDSLEEMLHIKNSTTIMTTTVLDQGLPTGVEGDPETSIDLVLGKVEEQHYHGQTDDSSEGNVGSQGSSRDGSVSADSTSHATSMDSEQDHLSVSSPASLADAVQDIVLESHQSLRWSQGDNSEATPISITSAGSSFKDSLDTKRRNDDENSEAVEAKQKGEEFGEDVEVEQKGEEFDREEDSATLNGLSIQPGGRKARSLSLNVTQVLLNDNTLRLSLNINNYDSDDTLSGDDSISDLTLAIPLEQAGKAEEGEAITSSPPPLAAVNTHLSSITVKEDRTGSISSGGSSSSNSDSCSLSSSSSPQANRKYTITPFVEKKGFLYKMGSQRKKYRLRYFVLRSGVFHYFKDSTCRKSLGEVKLNKLNIFFPGVGERKQSFQFTVHTESSWNRRPDYMLAAQSEREMKEWITAFKSAGQKANYLPTCQVYDN